MLSNKHIYKTLNLHFKLMEEMASTRGPVMKGYQEIGLVVVLLDEGQTLCNELRFHLVTTYDDLHPRLQVENTAICLQSVKIQEVKKEYGAVAVFG